MNDMSHSSAYLTKPGLEPRMEDVMEDPLVHLVMGRDGVTLDELRDVVNQARSRLIMQSLIRAESTI